MLKRSIFALAVVLLYAGSISAATVNGTAPTVKLLYNGGENSNLAGLQDEVNKQLIAKFEDVKAKANDKPLLRRAETKQLAEGFANANVYASNSASLSGYADYDLFAVMTGLALGVQFPTFDKNEIKNIDERIKRDGDINAGIAANWSWVNVGINSGFLYEGLYLNLKFGGYSAKKSGDYEIENKQFGIGASYSWIRTKSIFFGLLKWRGVSFGSGFLYQKSKIDLNVDMDEVSQNFSINNYDVPTIGTVDFNGIVKINPSVVLGSDVQNFIVPLEVNTSARLLWILNLSTGVGVDLTYGTSDITLKSNGRVAAEGNAIGSGGNISMVTVKEGDFVVDGSTKDAHPSFIRPRINLGVGLNAGPVKVDVPLTWYPMHGFTVAVAAGIVW